MQKSLPPPPIRSEPGSRAWNGPDGWYARLQARVDETAQILWTQVDTAGSNLTDIETRLHSSLQSIGELDETDTDATLDKHTSNNIAKSNKDHRDNIDLNAHGNTISATITFGDGNNIVFNATTGTKIGTATTEKLAFYGVTPVVQPTALTATQTTVTHTAPGVADYAIQNLTTTTPYGFVSQDEGNTVLQVIANLQTRVDELETKLQSLGVIA